jgi:hypothetical protein
MLYQQRQVAYQHKLEAIVQLANRWQALINEQEEWSELASLLKTFSEFAEGYLGLLAKIPDEISRPQFALNKGVDKLLDEWNALSRACEQRLETGQNRGLPGNLKGARRILQAYCNSWNGARVNDPYLKLTDPVVYFEKVYRLSRSVYAPNIPLLSIPLTDFEPGYIFSESDTHTPRWPALAHEFGHHIFWNALDLQNTEVMQAEMLADVSEAVMEGARTKKDVTGLEKIQLTGQAFEKARVWGQWLEEVFADICGALLEGLAYARSAQDIAAERARIVDNLIPSDHLHPSPYLRPLIALEVVRKIAEYSQSEAFRNGLYREIERLKGRWQALCGDIGQKMYPDTTLTMQDLENDIQPVVEIILTKGYWPKTTKTLISRLGEYSEKIILSQLTTLADLEPLPSLPVSNEKSEGVLAKVSGQLSTPLDENIPEVLKATWMHLKAKVNDSSLNTQQKALAHWSLLLGLNLSDVHFHNTNHGCRRHIYYWPCHTHDVYTGDPIRGCSC